MYFTEPERKTMIDLMVQHGIAPEAVLFVKRRGRMYVQVPGRKDDFAFLSRKATRLDEQGRWVNSVEYFVGAAKADKAVSREELLDSFKSWLSQAP